MWAPSAVFEFLWQQLWHSPLKACVPAYYGIKGFAQRSSDICLVTGFMAWHGSGLCQALEETQPSPVLFCIELLFCFNGLFHVFYCVHVTFYRLWQHCDRLQRALMIQIDYFTTGSLGQALRLVEDAFQPR